MQIGFSHLPLFSQNQKSVQASCRCAGLGPVGLRGGRLVALSVLFIEPFPALKTGSAPTRVPIACENVTIFAVRLMRLPIHQRAAAHILAS